MEAHKNYHQYLLRRFICRHLLLRAVHLEIARLSSTALAKIFLLRTRETMSNSSFSRASSRVVPCQLAPVCATIESGDSCGVSRDSVASSPTTEKSKPRQRKNGARSLCAGFIDGTRLAIYYTEKKSREWSLAPTSISDELSRELDSRRR